MQQLGFAVSTASMLAPALTAGAIVAAFSVCHYHRERRNRRDFVRWCESNSPRPRTGSIADPSALGDHRWTHPSGLYGAGTASCGVSAAADSVGSFIYRHGRGYALAILLVSLALAVRSLLEPQLHGRLSYTFFSAAVLFTAAFAGLWETVLALLLGFLATEWFIVEPLNSLAVSGTHGWFGAILYFTIGLGIVWFKRSENAAERQALASDIAHLDRLKELDRERALRATLAHIVETRQDATFSLTTEGRIMIWNGAAERLVGYSGEEAAEQPLAFIVAPGELPRAELMLGNLKRGAPTQCWQTTLNRKDGTGVEVSLAASAARDGEGNIVGVSVVARSRTPA
jgi:PAS domain S-box-containing protein